MMEDDKKFLDYPLSYHCRIVLYYNNPNIVFKVKYKDDVSTYTIDYNRLVGDIVKLFIEVRHLFLYWLKNNPQDCEGVDESRIYINSHGTEIDKNKSILESGISYDDEVSITIVPEEKEEPSIPELSQPSIQQLHVIAPYDDKECYIDLSSIDSVKSLFSNCIVFSFIFFNYSLHLGMMRMIFLLDTQIVLFVMECVSLIVVSQRSLSLSFLYFCQWWFEK